MSFVGGDITEINYKHPTLGSGTWFCKSGEDVNYNPGGLRAADSDDGVTGNGLMINTINRKRWSLEPTIAWDMSNTDEIAQAAAISASPVETDFTLTHVNGTVWGCRGTIVGDVMGNTNDATSKLKIAGGGLIEKIS